MASGRRLVVATSVLIVADVIGGFIAVLSGVNTWDQAWGFDAKGTAPLPLGAAQLVLAWLAARPVRPRVGLVAGVLLGAICVTSLLSGLFDGDLIHQIRADGWVSWGVDWAFVLVALTVVVGFLAVARARQLHRLP